MKAERAFVAERPAAQHCAALLKAGPAPAELLPQFSRLAEQWAKRLASALGTVMGGIAPTLEPQDIQTGGASSLSADIAPLAANGLYAAGSQGVPLLVSIDARGVLALVDRTFGGRGELPNDLPASFPMSAALMIDRLEELIATSLGETLNNGQGAACRLVRSDESLDNLAPFAPDARVAIIQLDVREPGRRLWSITLVIEQASLAHLFGAGPAPRDNAACSPFDQPFADLPLELSAVLVDMRISMAVIAAIQPGSVLPVSVARHVPLKIGGKTIATGSVGDADDRVAIRVTQAFAKS